MVSISPLKITVLQAESEEEVPCDIIPSNDVSVCLPEQNESPLLSRNDTDNNKDESQEMIDERPLSATDSTTNMETRLKVHKKSRRSGCGMCTGCSRSDCGLCPPCRAMVKFGGNGKMKKRCMNRKCQNMTTTRSRPGKFFGDFSSPDSGKTTPSPICSDILSPDSAHSNNDAQRLVSRHVGKRRLPDSDSMDGSDVHDNTSTLKKPKTDNTIDTPTQSNQATPPSPTSASSSIAPVSNFFTQSTKKRNSKVALSSNKPHPGSPQRYSSPKKNSLLRPINRSSPKKSSSNNIQFGVIKKESTVSSCVDHAPFQNLFHVCQGNLSMAGTSLTSIGLRPEFILPSTINGTGTSLPSSRMSPSSYVGLKSESMLSSIMSGTERNPVSTSFTPSGSLCGFEGKSTISPLAKKNLLSQIKAAHHNKDIDRIMTRYDIIKQQLDTLLKLEMEKRKRQHEDSSIVQHKDSNIVQHKDNNIVQRESLRKKGKKEDQSDKVEKKTRGRKRKSCSQANRREKCCHGDGTNDVIGTEKKAQQKAANELASSSCSDDEQLSLCVTVHITRATEGSVAVDRNSYLKIDGRTRSPSKRRASFRQAQEKIKCEVDLVLNKENKKPSSRKSPTSNRDTKLETETAETHDDASVMIVDIETPPTESALKEKQASDKDEQKGSIPLPSCSFGTQLWNDVYRPDKTTDVIGNKEGVAKLRNWLSKWKSRSTIHSNTDELTTTNTSISKKGVEPHDDESDMKKTPRRHKASHIITLDDSFNSCSNDSTDEGSEVGVALLLCGPCGCGKTASVYTCSSELGYKVIEVNSTDVRTRQNLTTILREATQSHHVSIKQTHPPVAVVTRDSLPPPTATTTATKKKGLMAFFKPKAKENSKEKEDKVEDGSGKQVTLETTTVTLLEEVDLLSEDEVKGFWAAIFDIVQNTKRPLIFTANDPELELPFKHTKIVFELPQSDSLSLHSQLLSLSHDVHMTTNEANQIAACAQNDLRKLFNILHFYLTTQQVKRQAVASSELTRPLLNEVCHSRPRPHRVLKPSMESVDSTSLQLPIDKVCPLPAAITGLSNTSRKVTNESSSSAIVSLLSRQMELFHCFNDQLTESFLPLMIDPINATPTINELYLQLDRCVRVSNALRDCDVITRSHDSHSVSHDLYTPWWRSHVTNSLIDELPLESEHCSMEQYRNCIEACLLNSVWDPASDGMEEQECVHSTAPNRQFIHRSHDCHMSCCEVFDVRSELYRSSLVTECLPYLHVICSSEKERERRGQTRRFTHYLNHSELSLGTIDDFLSNYTYRKYM